MSLFSINTNLGALAALQALDANQQSLTGAQNQVSTGKAISQASDNPAIYSIANTINANIAGLSAVSASLNFGAQIVSTTSSALASINSVLAGLQQTVTTSGQSGINTTTLQSAVTNDLALINQYAEQATFNGVNILAPSGDTSTNATATTLNVVQGLDGSVYSIANQADTISPSQTSLTAALGINGLNVENPSGNTVGGVQVAFDAALTVASFAPNSTINSAQGDAGVNAAFQLTTGTGATAHTYSFEFIDDNTTNNPSSSALGLQSNAASGNTVVAVHINSGTNSPNQIVGNLVSAIKGQGFGVVQNADGSLNIVGNGIAGANFGQVSSTVNNGALTSGGTVSGATVANGTIAFNANGSSTVTAGTSGVDFGNLTTTAALVTTVQAAITNTNTISSTLGAASNQITGIQNFTSSLSSALTAGVGALTDADLAAESAKLTSLQTKQQLATQSLSIANKQPQSLLTLFQGL
jgi:flagellin